MRLSEESRRTPRFLDFFQKHDESRVCNEAPDAAASTMAFHSAPRSSAVGFEDFSQAPVNDAVREETVEEVSAEDER